MSGYLIIFSTLLRRHFHPADNMRAGNHQHIRATTKDRKQTTEARACPTKYIRNFVESRVK